MKKIGQLIDEETHRQQTTLTLIASENYTSERVKQALASDFTNKYAEGQPGQRYYGGMSVVDELELTVEKLAQQVFSTDYDVNVQPYSGSIGNLAVYYAVLNPGDTIMGLDLAHGGHLTHGHPATFSGHLYHRETYYVDEEAYRLDYQVIRQQALSIKPKLIISGASAYSRVIDFQRLGEIAKEVGALHLADISHISGLVATGLHPTPFGHADFVMTTTHKILRGPRGALLFSRPELSTSLDKAVFPGIQGGPHMNTIAAIGVCLEEALEPSFKVYCQQVIDNAKLLASELMKRGLKVVTDGTDNHLFLVDLRPLGITGQEAQDRLEQVGIVTNKNTIPYDPASPKNPNGLRLGTPAITTRGISSIEIASLAETIAGTLKPA